MQDWGQLTQKPGKGCRRGERLWGRRPQQSGATSGSHSRDNRKKHRGHSGTNGGPQPCRDEWESTQIWVRTEERRRQWSREVPPPNTPLIHWPLCLSVNQHFNNLWSWCVQAPGEGCIHLWQEQHAHKSGFAGWMNSFSKCHKVTEQTALYCWLLQAHLHSDYVSAYLWLAPGITQLYTVVALCALLNWSQHKH